MKFLQRAFWAAVAAAVFAGGASAQLGGNTTGGNTTGGNATGGQGGGGGAQGGQSTNNQAGAGGQGSAGNTGTGTGTNSNLNSVTLTPPSTYAQQQQGVATSNILNKYYANPFYQGRAGTATTTYTTVVNPGGFAAPLYGTNGGAPQSTGTTGRGTTGTGGGGFGNRAGTGTTNGQAQVVAQGATSIAYTATIKFAVPTVTPDQVIADAQAVLNRSSGLGGAVQASAGPNGAIVLRGRVADEDSARLAENVLRLTPGIRAITNEITFPKQ